VKKKIIQIISINGIALLINYVMHKIGMSIHLEQIGYKEATCLGINCAPLDSISRVPTMLESIFINDGFYIPIMIGIITSIIIVYKPKKMT